MKKNILFNTAKILVAAISLAAASCTGNFEEFNTKPHRPGYVDPLQLLAPMTRNIISTHENDSQMIDQMIGMEYGGYTSANTVWGGSGAFATYNPRQGWYGSMFNTLFQKTYGNWAIIREGTNGVGAVYQLAQILRVATMLKVTDTYGPIPYSRVNGQDVSVAYDAQKDVYVAMLDDLKAAVDGIQGYLADGGDPDLLTEYDVTSYKGDLNKWVKYANSLRLRMAIRMSKTDLAAKAQEVAEEAVGNIGGLIEDNADNLYIIPESKNPYTQSTDWNEGELRTNASIVCYMNGYADARQADYFTQVGGRYVGLRSGMEAPGSKYTNTVSKMFFKEGTSTPLLAMCAAEVAFLKAEGALMQWNMGDTPADLYTRGVTLSFEQHGVANAAAAYLQSTATPANHVDAATPSMNANAPSTITPKWNDGASDSEKLERVLVQKWIAMYPCGFEAWCDIRRTGYPVLFQVANNLSSGAISDARGMRRVPFPREEFNTNEANVTAAIALLGGEDTGATDLWWAKKN